MPPLWGPPPAASGSGCDALLGAPGPEVSQEGKREARMAARPESERQAKEGPRDEGKGAGFFPHSRLH